MKAEQAAQVFVEWATARRLFASGVPTPQAAPLPPPLLQLSGVGQISASQILLDRGIIYVGVNETSETIVVLLNKAPRVKDVEAFRKAEIGGISIELLHGAFMHSGSLPGTPPGVPSFELHKGAYTCGSSIHLSTVAGAGTLGCILSDSTGALFGLSNNHVIADNNYGEIDLPIFGPGQIDIMAGQPDPRVLGHLARVLPLLDGRPSCIGQTNNYDAAIFRVSDPSYMSSPDYSLRLADMAQLLDRT